MGHPETPSQRSSVKDLGFALAGQAATRATGVAGKKTYVCTHTYIYIYIYTLVLTLSNSWIGSCWSRSEVGLVRVLRSQLLIRESEKQRVREKEREKERQTSKQKDRQTDRPTDRQTDTPTDRLAERPTDRQTGRPTDRQTDGSIV